MEFFIGIDGGGTKTRLKIADKHGKLLASCEGGPVNLNSNEEGLVYKELSGLINKGLEIAERNISNCAAICLGAAGAAWSSVKIKLESMLVDIGIKGKIIVTTDADVALNGAVGGNEGVIIISGTGSICYGRNRSGTTCRVGGWGHIIGDEGSGYYIGLQVIQHVMRSFDGREVKTLLLPMLLDKLKMETPEELIDYVYRSGAGKKEIAELAKLADDAYSKGDVTAYNILSKAAKELYASVRSAITRLDLDTQPIKLAACGSILEKSRCVRNEFEKAVLEEFPEVTITSAENDAAWGAVMMAMELIG